VTNANHLEVAGIGVEAEPNAEGRRRQERDSLESYIWCGGVPEIDVSGSEIVKA
jgi:hypothetical protein